MASSPTQEFLLTADELQDVEGKWKCLLKLRRHPKRDLPEIQSPFLLLTEGINNLLLFAHIRYTERGRQLVELGFHTIKQLEDIVIRVMVAGDSIESVAKRYQQLYEEANLTQSTV